MEVHEKKKKKRFTPKASCLTAKRSVPVGLCTREQFRFVDFGVVTSARKCWHHQRVLPSPASVDDTSDHKVHMALQLH